MLKEIQEILTTLLPFLEDMTSGHKLILWIGVIVAILIGFCFFIFLKYKKERDQKKFEAENSLKLEQQKAEHIFELEKHKLNLIHKK